MKHSRWIIAALAALWLLANPIVVRPACADGPLTADGYWQLIDQARSTVYQARLLPSSQQATRATMLGQLADQLESITSVRLPDGQTAPVDNSALVAALRSDNPDLTQIEADLSTLAQAHDHWPHSQTHPDAFDKLAGVLARPEFQPAAQPPPSPFQKWLDAFNEWLNRLLSRLLGDGVAVPGMDWIILVIGGLVLIAVAFFFWRNVRAYLVREAEFAQDVAENGLSASAAVQHARRLAAGSDYRQAMRYLYLAALLTLDERGVLRYDKALTNREVLRRAAQSDNPELAGDMSPVVDTFDRVWYGYAPVDDETYQTYTEQVKQVTEAKSKVKRDA
jgi:hypothetical protein